MNQIPVFIALLLFVFAPLSAQSNIPTSAWEQHPEGVALAMTSTTNTDNGAQKGAISVYIKNTSDLTKYYKGPDGFNLDMQIFYMDDHGEQIPLRDYNWRGCSSTLSPAIKPGKILSRTVDLNPNEFALIQGRLIKCRVCIFVIADSKIQQRYLIESLPRKLISAP